VLCVVWLFGIAKARLRILPQQHNVSAHLAFTSTSFFVPVNLDRLISTLQVFNNFASTAQLCVFDVALRQITRFNVLKQRQ